MVINNQVSPNEENRGKIMKSNNEFCEGHSEDSLMDKAINSIVEFASISSLLRLFGAAAVLVSMSMFLLQGWSVSGDFERFATMMGQTALLSAAGFFIVKVFKDVKGARLFFGLSLVSITANFTTLGALIYSVFSLDNLTGDYASFALWQAASSGSALMALGMALLVLIPIAWLAFSVLARPVAKQLTFTYVAMNLLLIVPVRELIFIVPLAAIALIFMLKKVKLKNTNNAAERDFTWNTKEANFARLTMFIPVGIMIVRSLMSYDVGSVEVLTIAASLYATSIVGSQFVNKKFEGLLHCAAFVSGLVIAAILAVDIFYSIELAAPIFALGTALVSFDLYRRSSSKGMQSLFLIAGGILVTLSVIFQQLLEPSLGSAIFAGVAGSTLMFASIKSQIKTLFWLALISLLTIPYIYFGSISSLIFDSGWMGFAIGGVVIITLASVLDRYGSIIRLKLFQKTPAIESAS